MEAHATTNSLFFWLHIFPIIISIFSAWLSKLRGGKGNRLFVWGVIGWLWPFVAINLSLWIHLFWLLIYTKPKEV